MNVLERERKKLEDRKQKNQDNIKANEKILTHLLKNKEDADIKLEIVKEKLQNLYNNKYTYINNDINIKERKPLSSSSEQQQIIHQSPIKNETLVIDTHNNNNNKKIEIYNKLNKKYENSFPKGHPFICACQFGRMKDVKMFIESGCIEINKVTGKNSKGKNDGYTGLMVAVEEEHSEIVKYLLEDVPNIDISVSRKKYGTTCLHFAAKSNKNSLDILNLLLNHKTCTLDAINKQTDDYLGHTPTDYAYSNVSELRKDITKLIKGKGGKTSRQLQKEQNSKIT